jgi:rubrerythrin
MYIFIGRFFWKKLINTCKADGLYKRRTSMKSAKEFLVELEQKVETLYQVSEEVTRNYFASNPSKEHLMDHFKLRMMNERWNMVEFAKKVAALPVTTSGEEAMLLCKQTFDEANHYRMVREVLEHLNGGPISMDDANSTHGEKDSAKGVTLIDRYEAQDDPLIMALYQFLGEGRAARVWATMAECVEDEFIATRYGKIARDEKFHSNIGRRSLELLATDAETQARVEHIARTMRMDLFAVSCMNTTATPEAVKLMDAAY